MQTYVFKTLIVKSYKSIHMIYKISTKINSNFISILFLLGVIPLNFMEALKSCMVFKFIV